MSSFRIRRTGSLEQGSFVQLQCDSKADVSALPQSPIIAVRTASLVFILSFERPSLAMYLKTSVFEDVELLPFVTVTS